MAILVNKLQRSYNGVKYNETVETNDKALITEYLENGFKFAGQDDEDANGTGDGDSKKTVDYKKITKKADLAAWAKLEENGAVELNEERTLKEMVADYEAAIQAKKDANGTGDGGAAQ